MQTVLLWKLYWFVAWRSVLRAYVLTLEHHPQFKITKRIALFIPPATVLMITGLVLGMPLFHPPSWYDSLNLQLDSALNWAMFSIPIFSGTGGIFSAIRPTSEVRFCSLFPPLFESRSSQYFTFIVPNLYRIPRRFFDFPLAFSFVFCCPRSSFKQVVTTRLLKNTFCVAQKFTLHDTGWISIRQAGSTILYVYYMRSTAHKSYFQGTRWTKETSSGI